MQNSQKISLSARGQELLTQARAASNGRASDTLVGGRDRNLRQTIIAICKDHKLGEHESPGEATLYVLSGSVSLVWDEQYELLTTGDLAIIQPSRHWLEALEDSVVLLTVAKKLEG